MHVVQVRETEDAREQHANEAPLLVRMDDVVAFGHRSADRRHGKRQVEGNLRERRTDPDVVDKRGPRAAKDAQARHLDVLAEGVGHEIDGVPQLDERADPVVLGEWSAPGLEKRLRRDHEDFHSLI